MEKREIQTIVTAHTIKGTSFVGVRNYLNSKDELSNQTILVGADYGKAKEKDIAAVREFDINSYESQFSEALRIQAKEKILNSLIAPAKAQSEAQKDAYTHIGPGLKLHKESGDIMVFGFVVSKTILEKGNYPHKNSREMTLCQNEMKKQMNLRTGKYRQFKLGKASDLRLQGISI